MTENLNLLSVFSKRKTSMWKLKKYTSSGAGTDSRSQTQKAEKAASFLHCKKISKTDYWNETGKISSDVRGVWHKIIYEIFKIYSIGLKQNNLPNKIKRQVRSNFGRGLVNTTFWWKKVAQRVSTLELIRYTRFLLLLNKEIMEMVMSGERGGGRGDKKNK